MPEAIGPRTLWAMHPAALAELLQKSSVEALLPDGLGQLLAGGQQAAARNAGDPIREGATWIMPINGVLRPYSVGRPGGMFYEPGTEAMANMVLEAAADPKIGTIVLKISSPGGLVWGTQEFGDAIYEARQSKPVIAVADKYAFSAAHWVATQATAFYATPSGQVGSVGVRGGHVDMSGFEDKIGMKTTLIASDPKKVAGHPYAPLSEEDRAEMQAEIDEMAAAFNAAIARGRGIKAQDVPALHGTGQVFSANAAAKAGVTDGVMTLREVIAKYSSPRARLALMRQRAAINDRLLSI
jgi:signal peptide peptidase SppA